MRVEDERGLVFRARAKSWRKEGRITRDQEQAIVGAPLPLHSYGVGVQVVFFLLTLVTLAASSGLGSLIPELPLGVGAIVIAEVLMARGWVATGVESALWIGGLFLLIMTLPRSGRPEALLVFALACAIAGARVRNPLFGAAAACFVTHYVETKFDAGVVCALILAAVAVIALKREWKRPSTEWLWAILAVVMPLMGYAEADAQWRRTTIALYAAFAAGAFVVAVLWRHHAIFFSAGAALTIASIETGRLFEAALEGKLAVGGALLLTISWAVSRQLRDRKNGLVVAREQMTASRTFEIAAALAASHYANGESAANQSGTSRPSGGGEFGGGGATVDY